MGTLQSRDLAAAGGLLLPQPLLGPEERPQVLAVPRYTKIRVVGSPFGLQPPSRLSLVVLLSPSPYDTSQQGYKDWTFMSTHFWDEDPNGTWTLLLENKGDAYNTGGPPGMSPSHQCHQCHPVPCCPPPLWLAPGWFPPLPAPSWRQDLAGGSLQGHISSWFEGLPAHSPEENISFPRSSSPTPTALHTPNPGGWEPAAPIQHRVLPSYPQAC